MKTHWMVGALAVVAVATAACRNNDAWVREPVHPLGPTLEVTNNTSLEYRVTVGPGVVIMARPGMTSCTRIGNLREVRSIEVFALASRTRYYTPVEQLLSQPGWVLDIGMNPQYTIVSLRPAEPCKRDP